MMVKMIHSAFNLNLVTELAPLLHGKTQLPIARETERVFAEAQKVGMRNRLL